MEEESDGIADDAVGTWFPEGGYSDVAAIVCCSLDGKECITTHPQWNVTATNNKHETGVKNKQTTNDNTTLGGLLHVADPWTSFWGQSCTHAFIRGGTLQGLASRCSLVLPGLQVVALSCWGRGCSGERGSIFNSKLRRILEKSALQSQRR